MCSIARVQQATWGGINKGARHSCCGREYDEPAPVIGDPPSTSFLAAVTVACACCSCAAGAPVLLGRGLGLGLARTAELLLLGLETGLGLGLGLGLGDGLLGGRGTLVAWPAGTTTTNPRHKHGCARSGYAGCCNANN
jgi:hypothetical protein